LELLIDYSFFKLNFHKVIGEVNITNTRSLALCKKLGFVEEGRKREHFYFDGKYISDVHKKYGTKPMKTFPNLWVSKWIYWLLFNRSKRVRPLYYMDYDKEKIKKFLMKEFGWQWYGGHHNENRFKLLKGWMQYGVGNILLNLDNQHISKAEEWIKKAIEADKRNDTKWNLAQDYALYAEFYKRKNDPSKAKENLKKAIETFRECGADGWVERYEKEMALL